jgi:DNA-binding NarL/FixJ family response regulator
LRKLAKPCFPPTHGGTLSHVATILLAGVDLFFRGKLDALLGASHKLITTDSVDEPDLVICDLARIDPYEVADSWPDIPILGYTNHTDTAGLRAAHEAGLDQVVARSALAERAPQLVDELVA